MSVSILRATYRVIVLKTDSPANPALPVLAICLEQNLVGRGRNLTDALEDLNRVFFEAQVYQVENLAPARSPDPDPALVSAFNNPQQTIVEGDIVLHRFHMRVETSLPSLPGVMKKKSAARPTRRSPNVIYEECLA